MFDQNTNMNLLLNSMELCELYSQLNISERKEFLRCIRMEYEGIDDEFSELIETIFTLLEQSKDGSELERKIEMLMDSGLYPNENINLVIKSMIEYLQDVIEYLEY